MFETLIYMFFFITNMLLCDFIKTVNYLEIDNKLMYAILLAIFVLAELP